MHNAKTTMTTMEDVILVESEDSENSIIEVEVPRKTTPPLIYIEDEEIILNVKNKRQDSILAKDFIETDQNLSVMPETALSSKSVSTPNHWTSDMIKFYDDDWGNEEDFIVEKLQEKMDKDPSLWDVSSNSRLLLYEKRYFQRSNVTCWNCGQRGHNSSLCPEPRHVAKCHMCGIEGHADCFCPNSICLNCGNHSRKYVTCCYKCRNQTNEICSRCQLIGHNFINCPDHWRLFHLTTGTTSIRVPDKNIYKSEKDMWCCNCGRKGHNQIRCKRRKDYGGFTDSLPFVISYDRIWNFSQYKGKPNDMNPRKSKGNRRREDRPENILRINPKYKTIGRDRVERHNKVKKSKKNKKSRKKKRGMQRFFDGMLI